MSATWRIAVRDARKAKGRSALVIAMIGLPILGVGTADVLYRTFQLTPEQKATRVMGAADASLRDSGQAAVEQDPGGLGYSTSGDRPRTGPAPAYPSLLPAGSRVLTYGYRGGVVTLGDRTVSVSVTDLPYTDPLTRGMYRAVSGRPAAHPGEVALSRELARRLEVTLSATVTVDGVSRVVTGVVDSQSGSQDLQALVATGTLPQDGNAQVLVDVPGQLTWSDVTRANAQGFVLQPRGHVPGEPPPSGDFSTGRVGRTTVTFVALIAGLVLLEIVLLAGPAFAVGVKRRSRDLALVAATGGERRQLRAIVLGGGVALGLVGGALGAGAGVALAWFVVPVFGGLNGTVPGPFEVRPLEMLAIVGVGVLTALLAAMIPARTAARTDVLAALTGRRGSVHAGRRLPLIGLVATVAGAGIALRGANHLNTNQVLIGSIVAELGLVATTPFLVGQVARLGRWLPVGPRFALRDAARNRGRTAPAVSAILAAVAGAIAVSTFVGSLDAHDRARYQAQGPKGAVVVNVFGSETKVRPAQIVDVLRQNLPGTTITQVRGFGSFNDSPDTLDVEGNPAQNCPRTDAMTHAQLLALKSDPRCFGSFSGSASVPGVVVGDADTLRAVTGRSGADYSRVLAAGGAVVPLSSLQSDGTARIVVSHGGKRVKAFSVPAVGLPRDGLTAMVLSAPAAAQTGITAKVLTVIALGNQPPSAQAEDRTRSALTRLGSENGMSIERGYQSRYGIGLLALLLGSAIIVLGASGTATGLAAADGKADLATLAAVGATPRTRRTLAAFQSAATAGLGTVLGVIAGLVPGVGVVLALNAANRQDVLSDDAYPLVLPWTNVLVTLLVVPAVAALAAALLTRSRLPVVRRMA